MIVDHKLRMDLTQNTYRPVVAAVQGEANTRRLVISLFNRGAAWEIPSGATAAVAFHKPDGTKGVYTKLPDGTPATNISGNTVEATLAPQALTCAGSVTASIVFYNDAMDTLATFPFQIRVDANPAAGADPSDDYYAMGLELLNSAYADLLDRVQELEQGYDPEEPPEEVQIPEWAQQSEKPEYTAEEVGAIPEGGDPSMQVRFQETHAEVVRADELTISADGEKNITLWYGGQTKDGSGRVVDVVDEDHSRPGVILRGIADPEQEDDSVNKRYVDGVVKKAGIQVSGAVPGQFLRVAEVDEKGVPTAWETAELPVGGGCAWRQIADLDIAEDCSRIVITEDMDGKPFKATAYYILLRAAPAADETWTAERRITVAPWTAQQAIDVGAIAINSVWNCNVASFTSGITNKATSITSSSVYMAVGKGMGFAHLWQAYNNGSVPNALCPIGRTQSYYYNPNFAEKVLQKPYSNALQFDGNAIPCFSAGSNMKVWAIDYMGEE